MGRNGTRAQPHRSTKRTRHQVRRPPFNRGVRSVAEDRTGALWFGTRGDGLARVDPRTGATRTYRLAESAGSDSHDYVASLLVDGTGAL